MNRIVSFDPENLTITAECGVTLPQIDEAIAAHKQMLALRPRFADRATMGGIVSTNDYGPHRLLYGACRDMLTGIKAALPNGEIVRFGGKCVKNVAGYAVEKLLIGSHGSLAAILEMTFRTLPRPEAFRTLALSIDNPSSAEPLLGKIVQSGLRPAALELLNPPAAKIVGRDGWCVLVGLEGLSDDVDEMERRLAKLADWAAFNEGYFSLWHKVTDLGGSATLRASCPLSETARLAAELNSEPPLRASLGLGLIFGQGGSRPGPEGTALDICRRLKQAFDPNGVLPDVL